MENRKKIGSEMSQEERKIKREGSTVGVKPREEEEETGERNVEAQANDE